MSKKTKEKLSPSDSTPADGQGVPEQKTISREELAESAQPKAPESPLEDIQDQIEGTEPPPPPEEKKEE